MKRIILITSLAVFLPLILFGQGSTYKLGNTIRIAEGDTVNTNMLATGQFIEVLGHLNDDLFAASQNLTINGSIGDDAIVAGRTVTVRGIVGDMLITAGETVTIDGEIYGDLFAVGNEVRIGPNAVIRGNAALAGNNIIFEGGTINGWLRASGNTLTLDGTVNNLVELYGNEFTFGTSYQSSSSTTITTTHEIDRSALGSPPDDLNIVVEQEESWFATLIVSILFYVSLLITGFVLILIFRETTGDLYRFSSERYLKNTGIGFLLFLIIPIAVIVLLVLVLTIPISLILMMVYGLALIISYLLVALVLGTGSIRYFKSEQNFADYFWGLAAGIILILILSALPYVGWMINILLIFFGLGTLLTYFWKMRANQI